MVLRAPKPRRGRARTICSHKRHSTHASPVGVAASAKSTSAKDAVRAAWRDMSNQVAFEARGEECWEVRWQQTVQRLVEVEPCARAAAALRRFVYRNCFPAFCKACDSLCRVAAERVLTEVLDGHGWAAASSVASTASDIVLTAAAACVTRRVHNARSCPPRPS